MWNRILVRSDRGREGEVEVMKGFWVVEERLVVNVGRKGWRREVRGVVGFFERRRRMGRECWCKEIGM